jgi:hypothetical protein
MSKGLSYADAVRLLGGKDSKIVTALEKITGGILLGAAVGVPALLGWFEAKAEFARLCQDLVRGFSERRSGLSRYDRTQRLEAAHGILIIAAYFEALAEADLPFRFGELELTKAEQVTVADDGSALASGLTSLIDGLLDLGQGTLPEPQEPHESLLQSLEQGYYPHLSEAITTFIQGLAVWERLSETDHDRFSRALESIPARARNRYEELFRRLATDFPEVACWASMREHQATRGEVRSLGIALADLERLLSEISTGRVPSEQRAALARAYRADLEQPVVESGDVPEGLRVPTLGESYVPTRFRVQTLAFTWENPSDESWWEQIPVREDLEDYLTGYLTSPRATRAPLLVLGQPGSGKSVLTRVLAARLPAPDFLPIRVVLREVPAAADLQDQVEHAIRDATGERLDWPALARSADDALPVILLDGFDELLQATGVSQTDYLTKVATFQRREALQHRPVAVIVTSRTSVAHRAKTPQESVALRLEPFDSARITAWLEIWNTINAAQFAARELSPLSPGAVMAHFQLAEQPLLLLMLALYDADGNALQHVEAEIRLGELYERLLRRFASREITKHRPSLPGRELDEAVEIELRRLSVVAFAMFNRGSQWVTETDLDNDLAALFGQTQAANAHDLHAPLRAAEIMLGRFFFVHRAQALQDDKRLETYEFLHATFGEFLVARLVGQVLDDIAARDAASKMPLAAAPTDDDLLYALLSFAVMSVRAPIIEFLTEATSRLAESDRDRWNSLLKRLFRVAHEPRLARHFDRYQPRHLPVTARHASYSANLVLLAVCAAGSISASELFGSQTDAVRRWHSQTLLWRSQLVPEEWISLVETFALHRLWDNDLPDVRLRLDEFTFRVPAIDPYWTFGPQLRRNQESFYAFGYNAYEAQALRRKAYFQLRQL